MLGFIIIGTRGLTSTVSSGHFFCPVCGSQEHYDEKNVRVWFTLYFIPIVPMHSAGKYIECARCRGTFEMEVLNYDPAAAMGEFFQDLKRVMILMAVADGHVDDLELQAIRRVYENIAGQILTDGEIHQEAGMAQQAGVTLHAYVQNIAGGLGPDGVAIIVQSAFEVAAASGMSPDQSQQLQLLPNALGITQQDFKTIIDAMNEH